mmetsp:Transcript_146234/g.364638  ORF Transcript_146234/g.364638 Transcript_146234/m.364638 type:complete len:371 (-) Transcript_146234:88-1200(-)
MSSSCTEGAERRSTPTSSLRVSVPLPSMSVKRKTAAASPLEMPNHSAPFSSKSLLSSSHASSSASMARSMEPYLSSICARASASTMHGDTAARPTARSESEARQEGSLGSQTRLKMARCSFSSMIHVLLSAAANSGKASGTCVVSSPPPSMNAIACNMEPKPRQTRRFLTAAKLVTGAMASMPMLNSAMVKLPSLSASMSSKITRASNKLQWPHFDTTSHHSRMSSFLLLSTLMASKAAMIVEYSWSILRLKAWSGWPWSSWPPFACAYIFVALPPALAPVDAPVGVPLWDSSTSTPSLFPAAWTNLILPPTSRSTLLALAPCMRRMTFLRIWLAFGSHSTGLLTNLMSNCRAVAPSTAAGVAPVAGPSM